MFIIVAKCLNLEYNSFINVKNVTTGVHTMLAKAMDAFILQKHEYGAQIKNQHVQRVGKRKDYFRASELGLLIEGKRKLLYKFFEHQITSASKSPLNLWQLENGDFVHERYQRAWRMMGIVVQRNGKDSMEMEVNSRNDEILGKYEWYLPGHYDGELDMNLVKAYATGKAWLKGVVQAGKLVFLPQLDFEYGKSIGYFTEDGQVNPDYKPLSMVADIKSMNPFSFKNLKNGDTTPIEGYLYQLSAYMYLLNTPYGCIYVENKGNNSVLEVQIVWKDFKGGQYDFSEDLHGEEDERIMRVYIDHAFFQNLVDELNEFWELKKELEEAQNKGDIQFIIENMPERCSDDPNRFPCQWSTGKCEFYDHCWNHLHQGFALKDLNASELMQWVPFIPQESSEEFDTFEYAQEYLTSMGERAIDCVRCTKRVTFKRIIGDTKRCPHCGYVNIVIS